MSRGAKTRSRLRGGALALLCLGTLGLVLWSWWNGGGDRRVRLRMTAGRSVGERQRVADVLRREAARRSIAIEPVETSGSEAAVRALDAGTIDVALVQGGFDFGDHPQLRQVASLHVEPLHLLVKEEIHLAVSEHLTALRGKAVGVGEPGSGTNALAREVMSFAGLAPGDYTATTASYAELRAEADRARLPDAVFMVSTLPSPIARHLVATHRYRLVALPFREAFRLGALDREGEAVAHRGASLRVERRHIDSAVIPAFAYEVEPGVPPHAVETLGTRLLFVARDGVAPDTIRRLLDVMFGSPFAQALQPPIDGKLLDLPPELPLHDGTVAYQRRNAPVIAGDVIDIFEKELSIIGALIGGLYFLGQWVRRRYLRRRDRGFEGYILPVGAIERRAMALEREAALDLGALLDLQEDLSRLKGEALRKFADGKLEGEALMSGFLTHVDNTRDYLTRMILHEREHLERLARAQGRSTPELWHEAVGTAGPAAGRAETIGP